MDGFHYLFVCLYHLLHAGYAVLLFVAAVGRLFTSRLERRLWLHRCQGVVSRCCSSSSSRWATAVAQPPSFSSLTDSARLSSSSLSPFPSFPKRPSHLGIAFRSSSIHFPLIPYIVLWTIQSHALSLSLFDLHSSLSLHCADLVEALLDLSKQPDGKALRDVDVVVRVKRRLRVEEWRKMEEGPVKTRLMRLVGRGYMPTEAHAWRLRGGTVHREGPWYTLFHDEVEEEGEDSKESPAWYKAGKEQGMEDDDTGEELKTSAEERRPRRRPVAAHSVSSRSPAPANGRSASSFISNGHADRGAHSSFSSARPPFLVNLLSSEHVWDELLNSIIALAQPSPSSSVAPFPPPNTSAPPSQLLRSHVLAHAFPLYPLHEVDLLLVFRSPLTLLSFPPWLQRVAEVDHVHEDSAAVWDRRDFEDVLTRYSRTVQKGGA